jgi:hypothetical protein
MAGHTYSPSYSGGSGKSSLKPRDAGPAWTTQWDSYLKTMINFFKNSGKCNKKDIKIIH